MKKERKRKINVLSFCKPIVEIEEFSHTWPNKQIEEREKNISRLILLVFSSLYVIIIE